MRWYHSYQINIKLLWSNINNLVKTYFKGFENFVRKIPIKIFENFEFFFGFKWSNELKKTVHEIWG